MSNNLYYKLFFLFLFILVQAKITVFPSSQDPHVLILRLKKYGAVGWGGVATHTLSLYKNLLQNGIDAHILVPANSIPEQHLKDQYLPYFTFKDRVFFDAEIAQGNGDPISMFKKALKICKKYKINIIHVNFDKEIKVAKKICSVLNKTQKINIVAQHHGLLDSEEKLYTGISALISANQQFINQLTDGEKKGKINVKSIRLLPPMTQLNQLEKVDTSLSKEAFFKKRFDLNINIASPVICCIAHLFECKNHENLFRSVYKLIYEYRIPVKILLAGDGNTKMKDYLKQIVDQLHLQESVYFLGFVNNVSELLFYSDINVLLSKKEPFGLAAIEAALMKKPMVISTGAGVANTFIFHHKTGLLCDPNSIEDIALQIKYLIDNPEIAKKLGDAAYDKVKEYYLSNGLVLEYIKVYKEVLR